MMKIDKNDHVGSNLAWMIMPGSSQKIFSFGFED